MIDVHTHILWGVDDGARDLEESVRMARIAAEDGISLIVATPHVYDEFVDVERIREKVEQLNAVLEEKDIPVKVVMGAEVVHSIDPGFLDKYTINGTHYILIEFPHTYLPANSSQAIFNLLVHGYKPIIVHPERNESVINDPSKIIGLFESGALLQLTANSIEGVFGPTIRECALYLLKKGCVSVVASDAHSSEYRTPTMSRAFKIIEEMLGTEEAERLTLKNPELIISGEETLSNDQD